MTYFAAGAWLPLLALLAAPALAAQTTAPPRAPLPRPASYRIQPASGAIAVDGRMDEPAWENAAKI